VTSFLTTVGTLEIDLGRDPISGRLVDQDDVAHRFTGWVGLTQVIGAAVLASRQAEGLSSRPSDPPRSSR
jgi:hypothetical protein